MELTGLLRPTREKYRAEIRSLFFARVGNTTTTETYQLRCQAVNDGLGWATATAVLDSALLAWKSLSLSGWNNASLIVTFFSASIRLPASSFTTRSTNRNG
ncbi:hypothetical protein SAMN05444679_12390 [Variovorax sp. CF079]|nr:hypothetical protein SAMN05444679_12390 [Variovorax sp. CF079]